MTKINVIPITPGMLERALVDVPQELHRDAYRDRLNYLGVEVAAMQGSTLFAVGGVTDLGHGQGEPWLFLTAAGRLHWRAVYRGIREVFPALLRDLGLTDVQALIAQDDPKAIRLAEHLGFVRIAINDWRSDGVIYDLFAGSVRQGAPV